MRHKIGDGVFRHVAVHRPLKLKTGKGGSDTEAYVSVSSSAEVFPEPGAAATVPVDFAPPELSFAVYAPFTREQWEELKREGDLAWADFDREFARASPKAAK